jgi:serine protease inhibitor
MPSEIARMNVNRPFLLAVRDEPTGSILFLGRVTDPSASH